MLAKESGGSTFDLPEEYYRVILSINSMWPLAEKDQQIADLCVQIDALEASLSETSDKLVKADQEKESLLKDNVSLSNTVRKLQRDVSKLEVFRRKLMQSLHDDEESSATGGPPIVAKPTPSEDDTALLSRTASMRSQYSDTGNSYAEDHGTDVATSRPAIPHGLLLASQTSTPRMTPPGSPPSVSASASPTRTSKPVSPRRHAVSFSTSRGMFDDRSSVSSTDSGSQAGRTRVDGKEFFRQVRSRLSYEQFGAFLTNVKELNSHKQTREETLRKAEEIFGPDNRDLGDGIDGKSTNKTITDKKKWKPLRFVRNLHRVGFSDSISTLDLSSLRAEVKKIDAVPPNAECQDCSTSTAESTEPTSDASEEASESEITESESHPSLASLVQLRGFFRLRKKGPGIPSQVLPPLIPKGAVKKGKRSGDDMVPPLDSTLDAELSCFKSSWKNFSLSELEEATNNFSPENLIGKGGYAEVYKGQLKCGKYVAVKRLMKGSSEEMTIDFLSELGIIVHVDHPNIAKMVGYGVEGGMYLVLQLSHNGSLSSILYGPREKLNWGIRFKIAVGTAEGLGYLHEGCQRRIIHKDIKAANILLSEHFDAQISDFGLSKWLPDQWTHHTVSKVEGTFGYVAPELFMHGIVDEKTDVYAFGVLLLELVTGRQAVDSSHRSLVIWAKPLIAENKITELIDPTLGNDYDLDQLKRCIATASLCIQQSATDRPQMSQECPFPSQFTCNPSNLSCLEMLKQHSAHQRTYSEEIFDAEEYNLTKCFE
ncbi:hypothetical protein HRI_000651800 [Hibiscus trionum]|uniref:non-specific serine/threonine protein kinase n=1 Tax=Hibiscus trionum TaxID=183268 RepID=A0A9W7H2G3_HIBTR|nr:hypothetical protein HRI_000651800 [Hibiscus trionum]